MKKLILMTLTFCSIASADSSGWMTNYSDYYSPPPSFYGSYGSSGKSNHSAVTSLDLDPQNSLNTSFRIAAREGRLKDLQKLATKGAEIDSRSDTGETALLFASKNCYPKLVEFLISKKANVNSSDYDGRTALILASRESCSSVVSLLLKVQGIRIEIQDQSKKSAMDYARDNSILDVDGPADTIMKLIYDQKVRNHYSHFPKKRQV